MEPPKVNHAVTFEQAVLKAKVAQICNYVGYHAITQDSFNILVDIYRQTIYHLGRHCRDATNRNRRVESTIPDLIQAYDFIGISIPQLQEHIETVKIPFNVEIEQDEPRPSNRIQRNMLVDDLLESEKYNHSDEAEDGDGKAPSENGLDEEEKPSVPLLKDTYEELSKKFSNTVPVTADKNILLSKTPEPVIHAPTPKIKIPVPISHPPAPKIKIPVPISQPAAPKIKTPAPVVQAPVPKIKIPVPISNPPAPKIKIPVPISQPAAPKIKTPAPVVQAPVPKIKTSAPIIPSPAPIVQAPVPKIKTSAPIIPSPAPKINTPTPIVHVPPPQPAGPAEPLAAPATSGLVFSSDIPQEDLCPECNLPDDGALMIQCEDPICAKWFHGKCVNVLVEPGDDESWFCKNCVEKQQSAFKRRRRVK